MSDTPETDAHFRGGSYSLDVYFARKLERERDKAKAIIESLKDALIEIEECCYEDDSENAAADASWHVARKALRKLKA